MTAGPEARGAGETPAARVAAVWARHPEARERAAAALAAPAPGAPWHAQALGAALAWLAAWLAFFGALCLLPHEEAAIGVIGLASFALALRACDPEKDNRARLHVWAALFCGDLMAVFAVGSMLQGLALASLAMGLTQGALTALAWRRFPKTFFHLPAVLATDGFLLLALEASLDPLGRFSQEGLFLLLAAAQGLLAVAAFRLYRDAATRFLMAGGALALLTAWSAQEMDEGAAGAALAFVALLALELLATASLLWRRRARGWEAPVVWALAPTVSFQVFWVDFWRWSAPAPGAWASADALGVALAVTAMAAALAWREGARRATPEVAFLAAAFLFVAFGVSPGIAWALLLLALGRAHADWALTACGYLAVVWAIPFYYYSLRLSLGAKGALLLASGLALLAGRWLLCRRGDAR